MFIALVFFLFMSFFLSGSETALTAVNKTRVQSRAENNDIKAQKLLELISKPDQFITGILIGNNISNIMLPTLVTIIAIEYGINIGIATGILTVVLIIFAEVLPKSVAATFSTRIAYLVAPVIRVLIVLFKPLIYLLSKFTNIVINILSKGNNEENGFSKEEIKTMVDIALTEGTFVKEESQRIKGAIDFYTKDVRDALKTPRTEIDGLPCNVTFEDARQIVMESNYTRYPVYKDNMDNIVGVFHSKLLLKWSLNPSMEIKDFMDNSPLFVTEFISIERVFKMMLKEKKHLAIVIDEYGGTTGIISHEDIIEAMIGQDIEDETDDAGEVLIQELTDTHITCNGKLTIRRFNEIFKAKVPEEFDTISGFIYKELGHIPNEGETFEFHHLHFEVREMNDNKIVQVRVTKKLKTQLE
ncbi:Mg2+ or Co2+ transporter CorB (HylC family) [Alkalihalophilus pseudofirmus OF4]|uniref:Mg2+ or Co2+ transporter CorB (HylC family) n=1 Tax=Alkalihalophilus pseudofirmus (strain ATCC BAA-2126 / JCM 17055 / OF4) TaxID=398511 RepID=D3FRK8_ALKPO|nr:CNNM domain-containing protein [Alkalihalophilus pseudofirmus]ADC51599.1 Mg2+ or Co2+ transporter CorB (HylC family) [Alkalihalophilus pseudofirmus OF4]OLS37115.1 hemolysin [Alkalihalophilus pseudofirmus]